MGIQFQKAKASWKILLDYEEVLTIEVPDGCTDTFEAIDDNAFYWHWKTSAPVQQMKLTLKANYIPRYFQVLSVNYNGNGWGSGAQYYGYGDKENPCVTPDGDGSIEGSSFPASSVLSGRDPTGIRH